MLGNARTFAFTVEVTRWDGSVLTRCGRVELVRVSVLVDEFLRHDPEELSPDFTDGVDTPVAGLVKGLVRRWVDSRVLLMNMSLVCNLELKTDG